jgi:hypothetical protein
MASLQVVNETVVVVVVVVVLGYWYLEPPDQTSRVELYAKRRFAAKTLNVEKRTYDE